MDVEEQLREWLHKSGVSPKVIGDQAGVDYSQVYKFIKGKVELRTRTFAKLCSWAKVRLEPFPESSMPAQEADYSRKKELRDRLGAIIEEAQASLSSLT